MKVKTAIQITHTLGKPSKMPGFSYGLPAQECKTGSKLVKKKGSTCYGCYALKGCYVFKVVQEAQYKRLKAIKHPDWVKAMALLINSKKADVFRWHDSGDVQDLEHLQKIYEVCRLTPSKRHWMPTREAWIKQHLHDKPDNLVIRLSRSKIDGPVSKAWTHESSVITKDSKSYGATSVMCPAPDQGGKCGSCRQCWNKEIKNVSYWKH